jgi:ERCC4-type nuclease
LGKDEVMKIFADHRENAQASLLKGVCGEVIFTQLPVGDYLTISGQSAVLVERKTVNDFISSVRSNRLWDQLLRMMKTEEVLGYPVKRKILLIQGNFEKYFENFDTNTKRGRLTYWSQLMGAFLEVVYVYNTPIIHAENDLAFKAFMKILGKRENSGLNDKLPTAKWYRKPVKADLPVKDRKKYILSSLPYVGDRLAENLLLHFHTISKVSSASIKELQKVPKIGKKKAELIYNIFNS